MRALGICLGGSTVTMVELSLEGSGSRPTIEDVVVEPHEGDPKSVLAGRIGKKDMGSFDRIAVTGRRFRKLVNLSSISEPEAVENAYEWVNVHGKRYNAVVSTGGETFMVYVLDDNGKIIDVHTGSKCASGTGEFFLQQIRRMGLSIQEAMEQGKDADPHRLSSRCTVFCKSDCTHATNKGVPKGQVVSGLCEMMGHKVIELLKKIPKKDIMMVGGTSQNLLMTGFLREEIEGLDIPGSAPYFEALGAALWALKNETRPYQGIDRLFFKDRSSFDHLPRLSQFQDRVRFKEMNLQEASEGDRCIIGLDVGSTTTKAVLLRTEDNAVLGSIYLRTLGDPVGASRKCYAALADQVKVPLNIVGLGVCGSGRQIAGLHAMTEGILNEIIAHATAAVYFDKDVDTIFEIGGQDAKYTYITNGVPSDYAMNEACSAGTGSFLEESAKETLGIEMKDIADVAMSGQDPPNFNDQCAAFISSDIKRASHEGMDRTDIVAGLVYSICINYTNRVKGSRPVGEKVFMQGGVCLNRAVPIAMAALTGKEVIVPPMPHLAGAFGVALAIKERIEKGLIKEGSFDLVDLSGREVEYLDPFTCQGGKERCDLHCEIARIRIKDKVYPFGGACNRYYNLRNMVDYDQERMNLVTRRERMVFKDHTGPMKVPGPEAKTIGINRTYLMTTYYPMFRTFFEELGMRVLLSDEVDEDGTDLIGAPFCYPAEITHGMFMNLLKKKPDYIFLPHIRGIHVEKGHTASQACPLTQCEPFYLRQAFRENIEKSGVRLIIETLNMMKGLDRARDVMVRVAKDLGYSRKEADAAFDLALEVQRSLFREFKKLGREALAELERDPSRIAIILFGRPYNAFVKEANMGIPQKIASRGLMVIPYDLLSFDQEPVYEHMYWSMGQMILKAAKVVKAHPQLFGTFITNFSCGPDSYVITYFRDIMGMKPSLTLELDSHTADAGLETRIEAAIDIFKGYRQLKEKERIGKKGKGFRQARAEIIDQKMVVTSSTGEKLDMFDPRVRIVFPSMGDLGTEGAAQFLRSIGVNSLALPPADDEVLKLGKANTSGKECLPMMVTTGSMLKYLKYRDPKSDEVMVYFMPTANGPCRFGQYHVYLQLLVRNLGIENVAVLALTSEDGYGGLGNAALLKIWFLVIISDVLEDIRNMLWANAVDREEALKVFDREWKRILDAVMRTGVKGELGGLRSTMKTVNKDWKIIRETLEKVVSELKKVPMKRTIEDAKVISLVGEIFVRHDAISRRYINERLAERGFVTKVSPVHEWMYYIDWMIQNRYNVNPHPMTEIIKNRAKHAVQKRYEKEIKRLLSSTGLYHYEEVDIDHIIGNAKHLIPPEMAGEAILTTGVSMTDIVDHSCGVISIGPFGCMPSRVCEAILNETMTDRGKLEITSDETVTRVLKNTKNLPFLSIESDGGPFPQVIEANFEAFCLQADRLHRKMMAARKV
ncbi:MAG: activase [Candidatus Thermoplasmatota archaeon]|nr:activase [Candidatus Thermoplasmatota archaeon]